MKTKCKQLLFALLVTSVSGGCGQSTGNSVSNNTDSAISNTETAPVKTTKNYCKKLDGCVFMYYDPFEDAVGKPDTLSFTIIFHCKGDSINGTMLGVDPEGEEGVYYYKSSLNNIR